MNIAAVLGVKEHKGGYLENERYIISWCLGHMAVLSDAAFFVAMYTKCRRVDLPFIPANWKYQVPKEKYQQFALLKALMHREDVSDVINACDAGREGELIFRNVYEMAGCTKSILRLWISSMEDEAIIQGFHELKPSQEYDNLFAAARCREWADWMVGINATRLFSVLYHRTLNVGRVVSPTLAMLVQREAEIAAFISEPFYTAELKCGGITAFSEKFSQEEEAQNILLDVTGQAVVEKVLKKEKSVNAPALYDLTTLQRDANRIFGYTAQQTLDNAQSLYEKKICTYPRTDSRYLTDDMEGTAEEVTAICADICDAKLPMDADYSQMCRSAKVSDHHAIIPTTYAGAEDLTQIPMGEHKLLQLIARQVLRAASPPHRYVETKLEISCGGHNFCAHGKNILDFGWKVYGDKGDEHILFPSYYVGDTLQVFSAEIRAGATKPPGHFTEDSLLSAMETAGVKDVPDNAERKGFGTPATRAGIIEKLISTGFVERQTAKKVTQLIPAGAGVSLVTVLPEQLQSPLLTAEWEHRLKLVEKRELAQEDFMREICLMVNELVVGYTPVKGSEVLFPSQRPEIGRCPRCGNAVTESKTGFFCESNACRFGLWKDNKYLVSKKISLDKEKAQQLLTSGKVLVRNIFSLRTGQSYDAYLTMTDDGTTVHYGLDFGKEGKE